jgi:hypothetical protein
VNGTGACAFSTITAAAAAARASRAGSRTIHVAAGVYSDPAETFPIDLRGGISLEGEGAAKTSIVGVGQMKRVEGGGEPGAARVTIRTGDPVVLAHIAKVGIFSNVPASAENKDDISLYGIFCDQGNAVAGSSTQPPPNLVVDGVTVGAAYGAGIFVSNSTTPNSVGCNARITSTTFEATNLVGVRAGKCDKTTSSAEVALELGDGVNGNTFNGVGSDNGWSYGAAWIEGCTARFVARGNQFNTGVGGIIIAPMIDIPSGNFSITGNHFVGQAQGGIHISHAAAVQEISSNVFESCRVAGVWVENGGAQILKARDNVFAGNSRGLWIEQYDIKGVFDFGTQGQPGRNEFRCNSDSSSPVGFDLGIEATASPGATLSFVGNHWDHTPPTSSSVASNGLDVFVTTNAVPDLGGAQPFTIACPNGGTAGP